MSAIFVWTLWYCSRCQHVNTALRQFLYMMSTLEFSISKACLNSKSDDAIVHLNLIVVAPILANSVEIQVTAAGIKVLYLQASLDTHNYAVVATCLLKRVQLIHRICSNFTSNLHSWDSFVAE
jgi:hypothetical protein